MNESIGTVLFDGQFWAFILEIIDQENNLHIGKYTFGPEPTNNDLLDFYLNKLVLIQTYKSSLQIRVKKQKSLCEQIRTTSKSKTVFKKIQKDYFDQKKIENNKLVKIIEEEKYVLRRNKRKEKHKGH